MHLKGLRIRGFKSFAEPVELRFERGVAVVVGPNGSGKSNIAEALQWAMASQPPSELRVQTGLEVLFNGSDRRQASGLCEVELVLDNEDGVFGSGRPEVSVMRRLARDGESSYLLNRVAVRRLDVQEALADAGLGRELHAVIGQGRVEEILLSRPQDRRGLIEEAAGLGKYKRRRLRALQKLRRVELNLSRARDLEGELKARMRPLALQATAAERAAAIGAEIDRVRIELLTSELAAARRRRHALLQDQGAVATARGAVELEAAALKERREAAEAELAGLAGEQERAAQRYWGLANALDRVAARREGIDERLAALDEDRRRAAVRAERLLQDAEAARAAAALAAAEAEAQAARLAALAEGDDEDRLAALQQSAAAALEQALDARRALAEVDGAHARAVADAAAAGRRADEAVARAAGLVAEAEGRRAARAGAEAALADAERLAVDTQRAAADAHEAAAVARHAAEEARELERAVRAERGALLAAQQAAASRAAAARRAVERGDGLTPALRRLRGRGVRLALDQLQPEPGAEDALAAALEWLAAEAVVADAGAALELLADGDLAGAALACLDRLPRRRAPKLGRPLIELVRAADDSVRRLLDGVNLVEDAAQLVRADSGIAIAPDGRGFDADRGIAFRVGGSQAAALHLRAELDAALPAEADAAAALQAAEARIAGVAATLVERQGSEEALRTTSAEAQRRAEAAQRGAQEATRAVDQAARADEAGAARLDAARQEEQESRERAAVALAEAAELDERRLELGSTMQRMIDAHAELDAERAALQERVSMLRAERAAARERAERARAERDRHGSAAEAAERRAQGARRGAETLAALAALLPRAAAALGGATERVEVLRAPEKQRLDELEQRAGRLAATLTACAEVDAGLQRRLQEVSARAATAESEAGHLEQGILELQRRRREISERAGEEAVDRTEPLPGEEVEALERRLERLERTRERLGAVNPLAQEEYEEAKARLDETAEQVQDLEASLRELRRLIRELSKTISERFERTLFEVQSGFEEVIQTLFPGGHGRLRLVEPEQLEQVDGEAGQEPDADDDPEAAREPEEPGVELEISPAGKQIQSLQILSGGEKALGAIGFLFALMLARPCPFYVLDEVEAALDDANIERFLSIVERFRDRAQFIIITHQKRTMEAADVLYGVTMAGDGISKVVSRRLPREAEARRQVLEPA